VGNPVPVSRARDGTKSRCKRDGLILIGVQCEKGKGNLQQRKRQIAMDAGFQLHFDVEVEF
jgi:hypothetical protein